MSIKPTAAHIGDDEAPAFTFVPKTHQGTYGDGWRQSKEEAAYVQPVHADYGDLPPQWTGEHVIKRLIEAFKTDRYCKLERPKQPGSAHPQIEYDDDDRAGWQADDRGIVIGPTKRDFARMEEAFSWIDVQFKVDFDGANALRGVCICKARKWSLQNYCAGNHLDRRTLRRRSTNAANDIADALSACRTPVS